MGEIIFDDEIPYGDEIRLDAGWVDLISSKPLAWILSASADFILARARISLKDAQPGFISRLGILHFKGDFSLQIVGFIGVSLDLWVIARIVGNRWIYEKQYRKYANRPLCYEFRQWLENLTPL